MSDTIISPDPALADPAPADPTPAPNPAPEPALHEPAPADPAPTPPEPSPAPEPDWRQMLAGEDEKAMKQLMRYDTPQAYLEKVKNLESKLSQRPTGIPGEDASDEEIRAFKEARGIPESPDKYEVSVEPPPGLDLQDSDKAILANMTEALHGKGGVVADPSVVNAAHEIFYNVLEEQASQLVAAGKQAHAETRDKLKQEWGSEFKMNVDWAKAGIVEHFGGNAEDVLSIQLADGTRLGDNYEFVKAMRSVGVATADDPLAAQLLAKKGGSLESLKAEKAEIMKLMHTDKKKYRELAKDGGRLDQINTVLERASAS